MSPGAVVCVSCMCVSICDTYNAAGPHSPSGMWDFQVQNRSHCGRRAGTNSEGVGKRRRRGKRKSKEEEDRKEKRRVPLHTRPHTACVQWNSTRIFIFL